MKISGTPDFCSCGKPLSRSIGPGRFHKYRGKEGYEIPHDMEAKSCDVCGDFWLTGEQVDRLGEVWEANIII